jgi:tRNA nucleotidyltransferase (CCA-adding enzyme)
LHPHWSVAKVEGGELKDVLASRQTMVDLGYSVDLAPAVMYFLTYRMPDKDIAEMQRIIPRKGFVQQWRNLEDEAKNLAKHLAGKEAATPSRTWQLLEKTRPETILFLEATTRQQVIAQKIKNYLTKWRQVRQKLPLPEMTELLITPQLPEYPKIANDVFMLMLDGKLRSRTEILKFLKPLAPPPPPPPPPPPVKRGRAAKAAAAAAGTTPPGVPAQVAAGAQPVAKRGSKPAKELVAGQQTKKLAKEAPAAGEPLTKPAAKPAAAPAKSAAPSSKQATKEAPKKASKTESKKAPKPVAKAAKKSALAKPAKVKPAKKVAPAKKSVPKKKKK